MFHGPEKKRHSGVTAVVSGWLKSQVYNFLFNGYREKVVPVHGNIYGFHCLNPVLACLDYVGLVILPLMRIV